MQGSAEIAGHLGAGQQTKDRTKTRPGEEPRNQAVWLQLRLRLLRGLKDRLLRGWQRSIARPARLAVIERIQLAPRQSLVLVEAEGVRLLVATSADAGAVFFPLPSAAGPGPIESWHEAGHERRHEPLYGGRRP
jgi:hypothetical protein